MRETSSWEYDLWIWLYLETRTFLLEWNWNEEMMNVSKLNSACLLQDKGDGKLEHQAKTEAQAERMHLEAKEAERQLLSTWSEGDTSGDSHIEPSGGINPTEAFVLCSALRMVKLCSVVFCHTIVAVPKWHQHSKLVKNCPKTSCTTRLPSLIRRMGITGWGRVQGAKPARLCSLSRGGHGECASARWICGKFLG